MRSLEEIIKMNEPSGAQVVTKQDPIDWIECSDETIASMINHVAIQCHRIATERGWWKDGDRNDGELIALVHSELSECLEALRHGNPADDKITDFTGAEAELADAVIRIFDYSAARKWNLGGAVIAKMLFNQGREYRHGKQF